MRHIILVSRSDNLDALDLGFSNCKIPSGGKNVLAMDNNYHVGILKIIKERFNWSRIALMNLVNNVINIGVRDKIPSDATIIKLMNHRFPLP